MRRTGMWAFVLSAVALAVALAGCGLPGDGSPRTIAEDKVPFDLLSPTTAPAGTGTLSADLYFVRENFLIEERRRVTARTAKGVLDALVSTAPPQDASSPVQGITVKAATQDGPVLDVTLGPEIGAIGSNKVAFAQLVYTATELSDVTSLRFFVEDATGARTQLSPPFDGGNVTDGRPVGRSDYVQIAPTTTSTTTTTRPGDTTSTTRRDSN